MKKFLIIASGLLILLACNNEQKNSSDTKMASDASDSSAKKQQAEFADSKYADMGKASLAKFETGDVDGWLSDFADNAVYSWSSGDSIVGKKAITDYWKDRRMNVIDSIKFSNDIWLPIKVNTPQRGPDVPGVWLLSWYQVNVKYKSAKSLSFWVHTDFHFDSNDKIDRAVQYIDRAPINAAVGKK
jgi:hypothetical protein